MRYLISVLFLLLPFTTNAALLFSEIAWMGTDEDANNEWIEVYNFGNAPADVTGWTITDGANLTINLSGTIGPHGVVLLERTDDTSVPGITALVVYTGALANTGGTLTLKDPNGTIVDEAVGGVDWSLIGGSNATPKKTAQRTRTGSWVTAAPTPGAENAQTSDVTNEDDNTNDDEGNNDDKETVSSSTQSKSGSNKRTSVVKSTAELTLTLAAPDIVYVNQPVSFTTTATGPGRDIINSLVYTWNFGDTYSGTGKASTHTYAYPGEYLVVVNAKFGRHDVTVEKTITVLSVGVSVSRSASGDIVLTNTAPQAIDISGYTLKGTEALILPPNTYLLKGGFITIAKERVIPRGTGIVALYDRDRAMLASEGVNRSSSLATVPSVVSAFAAPSKTTSSLNTRSGTPPPKPSSASANTKAEVQTNGIVAGTSTLFSGLTIPVYAAESDDREAKPIASNTLPYVGLIAIILVAVVLLYRRDSGHQV